MNKMYTDIYIYIYIYIEREREIEADGKADRQLVGQIDTKQIDSYRNAGIQQQAGYGIGFRVVA